MDGMERCPFCGGEVNVWDHTFGTVWVAECRACKVRFVFAWSVAGTLKDFVEYWNRRYVNDG